jgi:hypothetical protein
VRKTLAPGDSARPTRCDSPGLTISVSYDCVDREPELREPFLAVSVPLVIIAGIVWTGEALLAFEADGEAAWRDGARGSRSP